MCVIVALTLLLSVQHATSTEARASEPDYVVYSDMKSLEDQLTFTAFNLQRKWIHPSQPKPETEVARRNRLRTIAKAIVLEIPLAKGDRHNPGERDELWRWSDNDLAWVTLTKIYHESIWFSVDVHDGRKRGDGGKSVCLGQIMHGAEELVGTDLDSTRNCVRRVMAYLIMHQHGCLAKQAKPSSWSVARVYAGYGTGRTCNANHYMIRIGQDGKPEKFYWATERASRYWNMRNGTHVRQKTSRMLKQDFLH